MEDECNTTGRNLPRRKPPQIMRKASSTVLSESNTYSYITIDAL
jgi:hypothetical protein